MASVLIPLPFIVIYEKQVQKQLASNGTKTAVATN
jgi:hypothetical protein